MYIDNPLILTKGDFTYNLQKIKATLNKMKVSGLKCNIGNPFFGQTEMKYLGFWVTHDGVKPIGRKIEAITNMKLPTS